MKIIIVYDFAYVNGGAAKVAILEANSLAETGYDVTFFSAVGPVDESLINSGVRVICLQLEELKNQFTGIVNKIKGASQGIWNRYAKKKFSHLLEKYDPCNTIIHFHGWSQALSQALFSVTGEKHFRIAITCHDYEINCPVRVYYNLKQKKICDRSAMSGKCILTSCDKRNYAQKIYRVVRQWLLYWILKRNDVALIHLGESNQRLIDKDLRIKCKEYVVRNPVDIQPKLDICPHLNRKYLYIGRISDEKGIELFCEAVTRAGVEADVLGGGDGIERLRNKYNNIQFHGWLTMQEMVPYIKEARCLIVPSLCVETGPLNVPEVQIAYCLPCIIPSMCGILDDVKTAQSGLIYKIGDLDGLVQRIEQTKDDTEIMRLSDNCRNIDANVYSKAMHVQRIVQVYQDILQGGKVSGNPI